VAVTETQYDRLLSFVSIHQALQAEKLLTQVKIGHQMIPTPRQIDISCGECMIFRAEDQATVLALLTRHQVPWSKLFSRDGLHRIYEKIQDFEG
jgi:hypothetical protein